jgi:hypothetical protein
MLPGCLGGIGDSLLVGRINSIREGTADLAQDLHWRDVACPTIGVVEQRWEGLACVGMGDGTPQRAPQPLDAVGLRVVGRCLDQHPLATQLLQQVPQQE